MTNRLVLLLPLMLTACAGSFLLKTSDRAAAEALGDEIDIVTWNIGFCGLGADTDFFPDGGKAVIPSTRAQVERNLAGVLRELDAEDADIILIQEMARSSIVTGGLDLLDAFTRHFPALSMTYGPKIAVWVPFAAVDVGQATLSRARPVSASRVLLTPEPAVVPALKQLTYAQISRFALEDGKTLTVFNIHLSAFDEGGVSRTRQLGELLELMKAEYAAGSFVIAGGDWNLVLQEIVRPSTTEERYLDWIHGFPAEMLPAGWTIASGSANPSVRTLERTYRPGENYTTTIDGFILSPGIEIIRVTTRDTGFAWSDHEAVRLSVRLADRLPGK